MQPTARRRCVDGWPDRDLALPLRCQYTVGVSDLRFQWDARRNASNKRKHGISFEEARTAFTDEHGLLIDDPDHSKDEARFLLLGRQLDAAPARRVSLLPRRRRLDQDHLGSARGLLRAGNLHRTVETMRKTYDFSKARPNPYARRLKKQVTIRLDEDTINYFKSLADSAEIPYQTLINLYLRDCAQSGKQLRLEWRDEVKKKGAA